MATIYSSVHSDGTRGYITYTVTQTETTWSITASFGIQAYSKAINVKSSDLWGVSGTLSSYDISTDEIGLFTSNTPKEYSAKPFTLAKGSSKKLLGAYSRTVSKVEDTIDFWATWSAGVDLIPPSVTLNLTIPALTTYTVSYNANGGSSAPSSQTKYYGKSITLSSTVPTRTGYTFKGWATTADGIAEYQPSGTYTSNASVILYAVWEWRFDPATITNLVATRYELVDDVYVESDTGNVARVRFNWTKSVDGTTVLQPSAIKVGIKLTTASSYTWATVQNITDNYIDGFFTNVNMQPDYAYDVRVKIEYTGQPDVTADTYISESFFVWDVNADGTAISFGKSAKDDETGYRFADDIMSDGNMEASGDITAGGDLAVVGHITSAITACGDNSTDLSLTTSEQRIPMTTYSAVVGSQLSVSDSGVLCGKSGFVEVSANIYFTSGFTKNDLVHLIIRKGTTDIMDCRHRVSDTYNSYGSAPIVYEVFAGDILYLYSYNQTAARGKVSRSTLSWLTVKYL